jgi:microcystin-dependent protein
MSNPFLGQIQPFGFNFAPRGWAMCNGQLLSIAQNTALFSLLGTYYGGNGQSNFALPDLQSRVPMKYGTAPTGDNYVQGEQAGEESITLLQTEMPAHNHTFFGTTDAANSKKPVAGAALAQTTSTVSPGDSFYSSNAAGVTVINPGSLSVYGSGQPHTNLQPYLTINWCIAMQGIYPARN